MNLITVPQSVSQMIDILIGITFFSTLFTLFWLSFGFLYTTHSYKYWLISVLLPLIIAGKGFLSNNLSFTGTIAAVICGFTLLATCKIYAMSVIFFFLVASRVTKIGEDKKKKLSKDFKPGGQRTCTQVIASIGFCTLLSLVQTYLYGPVEPSIEFVTKKKIILSFIHIAVLSSIASSAADTFASELGPVFSKQSPRLIIKPWVKVPPGTNGGVTNIGSLFATLCGAAIGVIHYLGILLFFEKSSNVQNFDSYSIIFIGAFAGIFGCTLDSVLGSLFQFSGIENDKITNHPGPNVKKISGLNLLDNQMVNIVSSVMTAIFISILVTYFFTKL